MYFSMDLLLIACPWSYSEFQFCFLLVAAIIQLCNDDGSL